MINLKKLIDFLPFEYKDQDTYKVDGKGILERFLEICGNYFQDNITADIESILGITDYDTCPEMYLNYLWESFGQLPFARWNNIDEEAFKTYYNGLLSEAEINAMSSKWILPKTGSFTLTTTQIRNLLKYSISLLKIRGTSQFFEILFRMYGLTCTINDPAKSGYDGWILTHPYFDQDQYYDKSNFDNIYACGQCIRVTFNITGHGYSSNSAAFTEFRQAVENIIDRFKPYHVGADINYGFTVDDGYKISASFVDPTINYIQPGYITSVPILVEVTSNYQNADLRYQVSGDGVTWGYNTYESGTIFNATKGDQTYYFRSVGDPTKVTSITVSAKEIIKTYTISVNPTTAHITPSNPEATVVVTANLYMNGILTPVAVQLVGDTEVKPSGSAYTFTEEGTYEFQIVEYPVKRTNVIITKDMPKYKVTCEPVEFKLTSNTNLATTILKVEDDYGTEGLECYELYVNDGKVYKSGDTFQCFGAGIHQFACTLDPLENLDGVGIFTVYTVRSRFVYRLTQSDEKLGLPLSGTVDQNLYLTVVPANDPDNLIDYGVIVYYGNTLVGEVELDQLGMGKAEGKVTCDKVGEYTAYSRGNPSISVTWTVYSGTVYEEDFLYLEAVIPEDPNWITPAWGELEPKDKVYAEYQLQDDTSVCKVILKEFDLDGYDTVVCQETGVEYKFNDVFTTDKAGTYTFVVKGNEAKKATLVVKDFELVVEISCSPETATLTDQGGGTATTVVTCSANHKDFITDVRLVGQAGSHTVPYEFTTNSPGTYIFEAVNKPDVRCTFTVGFSFDVQPNELVWTSDDTNAQTFEIDIPANTSWTITM